VKQLVDPELSEPYSIFTHRLFLTPWPQLCHFCYVADKPVGVVVCKIDKRKNGKRRGYLGMIVVLKDYRRYGIGASFPLLHLNKLIGVTNSRSDQFLRHFVDALVSCVLTC
jgi:N-alpha-acetyltransferase 30